MSGNILRDGFLDDILKEVRDSGEIDWDEDSLFGSGKLVLGRDVSFPRERIYQKGLSYLFNQQYRNAEECFTAVLEKKPDNEKSTFHPFQVYLYRGISFFYQQLYTNAETDFNKSIQLCRGQSEVYFDLAHTYVQMKAYDKAEVHFKKAIQIESKEAKYYCDYGLFAWERGLYYTAIELFNNAIQLNPEDFQLYFCRILLNFHSGFYGYALADCNEILKLFHENDLAVPAAYYYRGVLYYYIDSQSEVARSQICKDMVASLNLSRTCKNELAPSYERVKQTIQENFKDDPEMLQSIWRDIECIERSGQDSADFQSKKRLHCDEELLPENRMGFSASKRQRL